MLKLVYTPTSEITDRDLVPGSKWRRVLDGTKPLVHAVECVLRRWKQKSNGEQRWILFEGDEAVQFGDRAICLDKDDMLAWLRRDFERVGEKVAINDTIKTIPCGRLFRANANDALYMKSSTGRIFRFPSMDETTHPENWLVRDLGPIEIDDSVKGVGWGDYKRDVAGNGRTG